MSVESSALEFGVNRAIENAARPENQGTKAQRHLEQKLDERPWNEKLSDEINAAASRLVGEGLGHSLDSMRVSADLNVEAVKRYHGELLSRSKIPTEMRAVQVEVAQLDPRHPIMGRNQIVRNVAQSSGLWQERPDNIYFVDLDPNQKIHRHAVNPDLVNLGGYWVPENTLKAVRDGMTVYHPFVEMERSVITLPLAGALVWNQAEQKFQPGFPAGATECFSMPYYKFKKLSEELDNPKQNKAASKAPQSQVQPVIPPPLPNPAEVDALHEVARLKGEEYLVSDRPVEPSAQAAYPRPGELKFGGFSLAAPDHVLQDFAVLGIELKGNDWRRQVGYRFVVGDMAGGSFDGDRRFAHLSDEGKDSLIVQKGARVIQGVNSENFLTKNASAMVTEVDRVVSQEKDNPAQGGLAVVDVYAGEITISGKGDPPVAIWREAGFEHRRGTIYEGSVAGRGDPSQFQLENVPQNAAHVLNKNFAKLATRDLDESGGSDRPLNAVGDSSGVAPYVITIPRSRTQDVFILMGSDGAQMGSRLLDPTTPYSQKVSELMSQVVEGKLTEQEASVQVTRASREINKDQDDITCAIIRVPKII